MPSGRWRLPLTASRPRRASTAAMSSTETTQPSQPPPRAERARTAWPKGALSRRGVVEHLDDLEVDVAGERQDHVAGAEARVHAAVGEVRAEQPPDALGGAGKSIRSGGEADVVQAHAEILDTASERVRHRGRVLLTSRNPRGRGRRRGWSARVGRVEGERRAGAHVRLAVADQLVVRRASHQLDELGLVGDVDAARARRAPRCCRSSTSRGRGRPGPSRGGRTRRSRPRCTTCRPAARRCGTVRRIGSCQQTSGLVSSGLRPCAARGRAARSRRRAEVEVGAVVEDARLLAVDLDGQRLALAVVVGLDPVRLLDLARPGGAATSSGVSWSTKPATRFSSSLSAKWAPSVQQPTSGASA